MVLIRFRTGGGVDPVLEAIGQCELPVAAVASVEFRAGQRKRRWFRTKSRWRLRARLSDRADPYASVGAMLHEASDPFLLIGDADSELVAEYHAEQLEAAAASAREAGAATPTGLATRLVPPVPLHIRTVEGTAGFDGTCVFLTWSGPEATSRKRKRQRREVPLADIARAEWVPVHGGNYGYLRVVERRAESGGWHGLGRYLGAAPQHPADSEATSPDKDFNTLRCRGRREQARTLLMAATITAHVWARDTEARPRRP